MCCEARAKPFKASSVGNYTSFIEIKGRERLSKEYLFATFTADQFVQRIVNYKVIYHSYDELFPISPPILE